MRCTCDQLLAANAAGRAAVEPCWAPAACAQGLRPYDMDPRRVAWDLGRAGVDLGVCPTYTQFGYLGQEAGGATLWRPARVALALPFDADEHGPALLFFDPQP